MAPPREENEKKRDWLIHERKDKRKENAMKTNQLERQFINGVDEWSGLVGLNGVGPQGSPSRGKPQRKNQQIIHSFMIDLWLISCGGVGLHSIIDFNLIPFPFQFNVCL